MPYILALFSAIGCVAAMFVPGISDAILIFAPMLLASFWLIIRNGRTSSRQTKADSENPKKWVIVDGSNVMYWRRKRPEWTPIHEVIGTLQYLGFTVGVMFDANAGYLLRGKYLHDDAFSEVLKVPQDQIFVVPKGTPADGYILQAARDYNARIVTNDRFRDWAGQFPEVKRGKLMIAGRYEKDKLRLRL